MRKARVHILHISSESGDHFYYQTKTEWNEEEIVAFLQEEFPEESFGPEQTGPGVAGSYLFANYLDVQAVGR